MLPVPLMEYLNFPPILTKKGWQTELGPVGRMVPTPIGGLIDELETWRRNIPWTQYRRLAAEKDPIALGEFYRRNIVRGERLLKRLAAAAETSAPRLKKIPLRGEQACRAAKAVAVAAHSASEKLPKLEDYFDKLHGQRTERD